MDSFKVTLVCLLISLPTIAGLSCLKCLDYLTDNQALRDQFTVYGFSETPGCRAPVDNRTTTLPVETCSGATSGKINACEFIIVSATISGRYGSADITATKRGCAAIQESEKDTCREGKASMVIRGMTDVEGSTCYCSTDKCNGQTRLIPAVTVFFLSCFAFHFLRQ